MPAQAGILLFGRPLTASGGVMLLPWLQTEIAFEAGTT